MKFSATLLFLFCLLPIFSIAQSSVDASKSSVFFVFVDDDVDGSISGFEFTGTINLEDLSKMILSGSVVMETLDTDNWLRTSHLSSQK